MRTPVPLEEVVITHEIAGRAGREPNPEGDLLALMEIAKATPEGQVAILRALCRLGLQLCRGDSCGINLLDRTTGTFKWLVIKGRLSAYEGGTAPADHSPCGLVVRSGAPQLLRESARYFDWIGEIDIPIVESLIIPLYKGSNAIGTMWAVIHDEARQFDREDLRLLELLSRHAASAIALNEELY